MRGLAAVFVALACASGAEAGQPGELIERTLAIVAGQAITLTDVRGALALGLIDIAGRADDAVTIATRQLIDRAVVLREVQRYAPPEPSEAAVAARLQQVIARFKSPNAYQQALASNALSEEAVIAWIRDDLRIAAYVDQRFAAAESKERRAELVADWIADVRRRTPIVEIGKD